MLKPYFTIESIYISALVTYNLKNEVNNVNTKTIYMQTLTKLFQIILNRIHRNS
jgi:hypothetical protein